VAPVTHLPVLPPPQHPTPQTDYYEADVSGPDQSTHLWIYAPSERAQDAKLPAILIAPAGSDLLHGMRLGNGDRPEHLPYVTAGFVVVAYELSGGTEDPDAHDSFAKAQGGLVNGLAALAFAKQQIPFVDSSKIFAVGHSSAGDAALLLGAHAPSLKGAAIYNSAGDGCWHQSHAVLKRLAGSDPHFAEFCQRTRAASHVGHLTVPIFLFTSGEDTTCPPSSVKALAARLHQAGRACKFVEASSGDHYSSMLEQGIPTAIAWMRSLL